MSDAKEPIKLRKRLMPSGNTSLYLDIYMDGKRSYEYLRLYLIPERNRKDRDKNKETLQLAEAIRAKRVIDLRNGKYGFDSVYRLDTDFMAYFRSLTEEHRKDGKDTWRTWAAVGEQLEAYCKPKTTFRDITTAWLQGFKDFLDKKALTTDGKPFAQNTKVSYFKKVRACINKAFDDRIIPHNPVHTVSGFSEEEKERSYLTIEELRLLAQTECDPPILKRAFLFSCLTGLRKSDIAKMTWAEVRQQGDFTRIIFKQKKTLGQEYLDISPEAVPYLGQRREGDRLVFEGFHYSSSLMKKLRAWAETAGITKDITFHTGRHTFAVLMLDLGADIYTVQKLLGHRLIATTQIYANIMDKKKQAAVSKIPQINLSKTPDDSQDDKA